MSTTDPEAVARLLDTVESALGWQFDPEEFDDRLRAQKFVYIAEGFGADVPYDYGIHLHGPYSPDLADDYYSDAFADHRGSAATPEEFDVDGFTRLVEGRSTEWLEWAATIKAVHERNTSEPTGMKHPEVVRRVTELKDVSRDTVKSVYDELLTAGVVG